MSKSKRRTRRSDLKAKREPLSIGRFKFRQLRNTLAPIEFLHEAQLEKLHNASMQILEEDEALFDFAARREKELEGIDLYTD